MIVAGSKIKKKWMGNFTLYPNACTFTPTNFLNIPILPLFLFSSPSLSTFPNLIWVHPHIIFFKVCISDYYIFFHYITCPKFFRNTHIHSSENYLNNLYLSGMYTGNPNKSFAVHVGIVKLNNSILKLANRKRDVLVFRCIFFNNSN